MKELLGLPVKYFLASSGAHSSQYLCYVRDLYSFSLFIPQSSDIWSHLELYSNLPLSRAGPKGKSVTSLVHSKIKFFIYFKHIPRKHEAQQQLCSAWNLLPVGTSCSLCNDWVQSLSRKRRPFPSYPKQSLQEQDLLIKKKEDISQHQDLYVWEMVENLLQLSLEGQWLLTVPSLCILTWTKMMVTQCLLFYYYYYLFFLFSARQGCFLWPDGHDKQGGVVECPCRPPRCLRRTLPVHRIREPLAQRSNFESKP